MVLFGIYCLFWLIYYVAVVILYRQTRRTPVNNIFHSVVILISAWIIIPFSIIYLTHDIPLTAYLKSKYCCGNNMVQIIQTISNPDSVYWENNVSNGFSKENRHWMVERYLDGIHLKTLALNGDDGNIYIYHGNKDIFKNSLLTDSKIKELENEYKNASKATIKNTTIEKERFNKSMHPNFSARAKLRKTILEQRAEELIKVIENVEVIPNNSNRLLTNYVVKLNKVPMPDWHKKYVYSDKMIILDGKNNQVIGSAERLLRYGYKLEIDLVHTSNTKVGFTVCGKGKITSFAEEVIFPHANELRALINKNSIGTQNSEFDYIVGN